MNNINVFGKPIVVISGINLFEGGPLSVYYDCLDTLVYCKFDEKYSVIAFVHRIELFEKYKNTGIIFIPLPCARKNYLFRFYYEFVYFRKFSSLNNIHIWISLHDITPNVKAEKLYTYCHNPTPFLRVRLLDLRYSLKTVLFALFYRYLYRINIKNNTSIIVQSDWMRDKFKKMFGINNIIVARPVIEDGSTSIVAENSNVKSARTTFFYPAFPRFFKGFELLCKAAEKLELKHGRSDFEIILTINGKENAYSKDIYSKYGRLKTLKFVGLLKRNEVFNIYKSCNALLFPSRLETWGLPITEFKKTKKPIFLIDLPYAHETLGNYEKVCFFSPDSEDDLINKILGYLDKKNVFESHLLEEIPEPYAKNWLALLDSLFK